MKQLRIIPLAFSSVPVRDIISTHAVKFLFTLAMQQNLAHNHIAKLTCSLSLGIFISSTVPRRAPYRINENNTIAAATFRERFYFLNLRRVKYPHTRIRNSDGGILHDRSALVIL